MKKIKIPKDMLSLVPKEFKTLPDVDYKLTKIENTRKIGFVFSGDTTTGPLSIVEVIGAGKPGVKVINRNDDGDLELTYIRTSPIVEVLDKTDTTLTFRTEGGVYKLETVLGNA